MPLNNHRCMPLNNYRCMPLNNYRCMPREAVVHSVSAWGSHWKITGMPGMPLENYRYAPWSCSPLCQCLRKPLERGGMPGKKTKCHVRLQCSLSVWPSQEKEEEATCASLSVPLYTLYIYYISKERCRSHVFTKQFFLGSISFMSISDIVIVQDS